MNADFAKALVEAQKEMPAIEPDATNPHFKSKFVSLDHLIAKAVPVLNKHGIAIAQFPTVHETGQPTLTTKLIHAASGEEMAAEMLLFLPKQDPQGQGSALTYARRYALAAALGISGEKDDDAESAAEATTKQPKAGAVDPEQKEKLRETIARLEASGDLSIEQLDSVAGGKFDVDALTKKQAADLIGRLTRYEATLKEEAVA